MKNFLFLIVLIFQTTILYGHQIVLLYGSGSAGKSTLSREMRTLNPHWCHVDEDEVFNEMWLEHIFNLFPKESKCICEVLPYENLFQAIKNSTIIFPENVTCSQKESVKNAIEMIQCGITENDPGEFRKRVFQHFEQLILDLVREKINGNESIILDRWFTTPEMLLQAFPDILVTKVLVFSTLEHTLDNFNKRNERAVQTRNSSSHRLYKNCIPSYMRLYKFSEDPLHSLYCYQRSEIDTIFNEIKDALLIEKTASKKSILFQDITKDELDRLKEAFISTKTGSDTLFLSPIDQYDFIIDTQNIDSQKLQHMLFRIEFPQLVKIAQQNEKDVSTEIMATKALDYPQNLYKILSLRNWQATHNRKTVALSAADNLFIHFSTEDQMEKIIEKYWYEAEQFVILKIDRSKLEGRLVYETNAGGNTKYFHLYDGFIPFNAILESKIVYRQPLACSDMHPLEIVQVGDSVLRKPARELSTEEILSPEIQDLIEKMKVVMRAESGVGLAAPQVGQPLQLAVIEDVDHSHLTPQQLAERDRHPVPFHVIINPRMYIEEDSNKIEFFEGCLSIPEFVGVVPRAQSVRVECLNERGEPIIIQAKGWYARILQHEIDHLNAILYIDRALLPTLMTEENYIKLWKGKNIKEILDNLVLS